MHLIHVPPRAMLAGLAAFSAAALAAGVGRAALTAYLPVALERIRDAPGLIGVVMLVNVAAGFVVPLWVGVWSDRLRARGHGRTVPFVLGGGLLSSGGLIAVALGTGTGYIAMAAAALVAYVGLNAVTTAHRALIPETYGDDDRAAATGAEELAMLLGTTLGVAIGGLLVEWRIWAPFAAAAVLVPLLTAPTVRWMRGRERTGDPVPPARGRAPLHYYATVATRPGVNRLLLAQGLWVLGYAALPAFFVLYATKELGLRPAAAGGMLVLFGAVSGGAMVVAGLEGHAGRQTALLGAGVVLMGCGLLAMTPARDVGVAVPGMVAAAAGYGLLSALGFPVMSRYIPPGEAGAYTAVYFSVRSVAGAVALPLAGGVIATTGSYRSLVALGGVVTLLALVPLAPLVGPDVHRGFTGLPVGRAIARRALVLAAVTAGTLVAGLVVAETRLSRIDHALYRLLNPMPAAEGVVDVLLVGPDAPNYALLAAGAWLAALRWRPGRATATVTSVALAGATAFVMVRVIWALWERPRPQEVLGDAVVGGHDWAPYPSFPSGHVAVWLAMVVAIVAVFPRARVPLGILVATVALTRVTAGAHFPSDVVAAAVIGWAAARAVRGLTTVSPPARDDGGGSGPHHEGPAQQAPPLPVHPAQRHPDA